jgi:hypothetical protein
MTPTQERLHKEHVERRQRLWPMRAAMNAELVSAPKEIPPAAVLAVVISALPEPPAYRYRPVLQIVHSIDEVEGVYIPLPRILGVVSRYYDVSVQLIRSDIRQAWVVRPRQVVAYLCRQLTTYSYPQIGRALRKDHTSALSAVHRVQKLLAEGDAQLAQEIESIRKQLEAVPQRLEQPA